MIITVPSGIKIYESDLVDSLKLVTQYTNVIGSWTRSIWLRTDSDITGNASKLREATRTVGDDYISSAGYQ